MWRRVTYLLLWGLILLSPKALYAQRTEQETTLVTTWQRQLLDRLSVKVGLNVGGSIPTRRMDGMRVRSYPLPFLPQVAVRHHTSLSPALGLEVGLRFEYKGMRPRAWVHDYYTSVNRSQQGRTARVEGHFTGEVSTEHGGAHLSLPVRVNYRLGERAALKLGGYLAYVLSPSFQGAVEKGYFWTKPSEEGMPSDKIAIERETYNFSSELRPWEGGLETLFSYRFTTHWAIETGFSYALSSIFQSSFTGLSSPMRNVYFSLGVGYHFAGL